MLDFHTRYRPLTSRPYLSDDAYREFCPCARLQPFIACYWTAGAQPQKGKEVLIIPDTCMDIIIRVNHTRQEITGYLCTIGDKPYMQEQESLALKDQITCFAIRFHFWSAYLFLKLDFGQKCNRILPLEYLDQDWQMFFRRFLLLNGEERFAWTETFLLQKLTKIELNFDICNAVRRILDTRGCVPVKAVCEYGCVSQRKLERLFLSLTGLTPKRLSSLVRYQNVWREAAFHPDFDIHEAVLRYGYTDQSHLLNDFKRFHGVTPKMAAVIAEQNR